MNYRERMSKILILEGVSQDFKSMIKGDKDLPTDKVDRIDAIYKKYEKEISKIEKKYKLGADELGKLLMNL